jgi:CRP-like cAMP-binding protein
MTAPAGNNGQEWPLRLYFRPHLVDENPEWLDVLHHGEKRVLPPKADYCPQNHELVFVLKGYLQSHSVSTSGECRLMYNVGRNSVANAGSVVTGCNNYIRLRSKKECTIAVFDAYKVYDYAFVERHPELLISLSSCMAKTTSHFYLRAYNTYFHSCMAKISEVLYSLTTRKGDSKYQYMEGMTQSDIGAFAGAHPVTVSNVLEKLRFEGVIGEVTSSYVEVYNYDRLCELKNMAD